MIVLLIKGGVASLSWGKKWSHLPNSCLLLVSDDDKPVNHIQRTRKPEPEVWPIHSETNSIQSAGKTICRWNNMRLSSRLPFAVWKRSEVHRFLLWHNPNYYHRLAFDQFYKNACLLWRDSKLSISPCIQEASDHCKHQVWFDKTKHTCLIRQRTLKNPWLFRALHKEMDARCLTRQTYRLALFTNHI